MSEGCRLTDDVERILHTRRVEMLCLVKNRPGHSIRWYCNQLDTHYSTASKIINGFSEWFTVERDEDSIGKPKLIGLTEYGKRIAEALEKLRTEANQQ